MRMLRCFVAGLLITAAGTVCAHRGQDVLTVVEIDAKTGEVHATHHFAAHDIEPTLPQLSPGIPPNLDDTDAQTAFTTYLGKQFSLVTDQGPVELQLDSLQLAGDDVRALYHGRIPAKATRLGVNSNLVANLAHDSTHQVNVRRNGITRTLVFESSGDTATVELDNHAESGH